MRQPRSPGWRTHLMFVAFDGEVFVAIGMDALDAPFTVPAAFVAAGFACYEQSTLTLTAADLVPPPLSSEPDFELRPLRLPDEADRVVELNMACNAVHVRGWHTLVMGTDPHDVVIGIYRSVGFSVVDTLWLLERRPAADRGV